MRIWCDVPDEWKDLIEVAKKREGLKTTSAYVRELIRKDLKDKGLFGLLRVFMKDEEGELYSRWLMRLLRELESRSGEGEE
jgi:hypothetical protein